LCNLLVP